MTLQDMLARTVYDQDVRIFDSNNDGELLFEGTVEEATEEASNLPQKVKHYAYVDNVLNIYVEISKVEMSNADERITAVENRELRENIKDMTSGCLLTKSEYAEIQAVLARACARIMLEEIMGPAN